MILRMLDVVWRLSQAHGKGGLISSRLARQISKHLYVVECAVRRLLVLRASTLEVETVKRKPRKSAKTGKISPKRPGLAGFPLSELASFGLNRRPRMGDGAKFWESLNPDAVRFRPIAPLNLRADRVRYVLAHLDDFAARIARRKTSPARNPLGVAVFVSPDLPNGRRCPRHLEPDEWRELSALHVDALNVIRAWWAPP